MASSVVLPGMRITDTPVLDRWSELNVAIGQSLSTMTGTDGSLVDKFRLNEGHACDDQRRTTCGPCAASAGCRKASSPGRWGSHARSSIPSRPTAIPRPAAGDRAGPLLRAVGRGGLPCRQNRVRSATASTRGADERWRSIDQRATAIAGLAVITTVIAAFIWEVAHGRSGQPFALLGAIARSRLPRRAGVAALALLSCC